MCKEAPAARERGPSDQGISHGWLAWKRIRPQSEGQLGTILAVFLEGSTVELTATTPTIESAAKVSRQCEDTDRSEERRESRNQGTQESLDDGRLPWR